MTLEHFHSPGKMPVIRDRLKMTHSNSAIKLGYRRNSLVGILSKPVAFDLHSFEKLHGFELLDSLSVKFQLRVYLRQALAQ